MAALPKSGRKPLNTDRDVVRGNPSKGESKPSADPDGGRFVAIRGTGSNAPASTDEHVLKPRANLGETRS